MICPKCKKNVGLIEAIEEWDSMFGDDASLDSEFPVYINLLCKNCGRSVAGIFIEPVIATEKVKSPALGGKKVHISIHPGQKRKIEKDVRKITKSKRRA